MGTMEIGEEDDTITKSPVIIGNTYGIKSSGKLRLYDGIIKGITGTISGTITKQQSNTTRIYGEEIIDGQTYNVEYLEHNN